MTGVPPEIKALMGFGKATADTASAGVDADYRGIGAVAMTPVTSILDMLNIAKSAATLS